LLALVRQELRPIDEPLVDLLQRFGVVAAEADLFPPAAGQVRALGRFDVEVEALCGWVGADGGVAGVGQGAGLAVTEAGDVVFAGGGGSVGGVW